MILTSLLFGLCMATVPFIDHFNEQKTERDVSQLTDAPEFDEFDSLADIGRFMEARWNDHINLGPANNHKSDGSSPGLFLAAKGLQFDYEMPPSEDPLAERLWSRFESRLQGMVEEGRNRKARVLTRARL